MNTHLPRAPSKNLLAVGKEHDAMKLRGEDLGDDNVRPTATGDLRALLHMLDKETNR